VKSFILLGHGKGHFLGGYAPTQLTKNQPTACKRIQKAGPKRFLGRSVGSGYWQHEKRVLWTPDRKRACAMSEGDHGILGVGQMIAGICD